MDDAGEEMHGLRRQTTQNAISRQEATHIELAELVRCKATQIDIWRQRATQLGRRAVFDKRHSEEELGAVTAMQKREIYPVFQSLLAPGCRKLVDYGCGYGRFSGDLADAIDGQVLALEPVAELLAMAPPHPNVAYRVLEDPESIPADSGSVDAVWCCLVLGTLPNDDALRQTAGELTRVLRPGGLALIVENVSVRPGATGMYRKRSIDEVLGAFPEIALSPLHQYVDIDETVVIFGGYKRA